MKRPIFAPLLAALAFASCETAHKAAVSTYRVVAAPVTYVGHKLGVDEEIDAPLRIADQIDVASTMLDH